MYVIQIFAIVTISCLIVLNLPYVSPGWPKFLISCLSLLSACGLGACATRPGKVTLYAPPITPLSSQPSPSDHCARIAYGADGGCCTHGIIAFVFNLIHTV